MIHLLCLISLLPTVALNACSLASSNLSHLSRELHEYVAGHKSYAELIALTDEMVDRLRVESTIANVPFDTALKQLILDFESELHDLYDRAYDRQNGHDARSCARKGHWTWAALISGGALAAYSYRYPDTPENTSPEYQNAVQELQDQNYSVAESLVYNPWSESGTSHILTISPQGPLSAQHTTLMRKLYNTWSAQGHVGGCKDPLKALLICSTLMTTVCALVSWLDGSSTNRLSSRIARTELVLQRLMGWLSANESCATTTR
jgi:hypothetical protein